MRCKKTAKMTAAVMLAAAVCLSGPGSFATTAYASEDASEELTAVFHLNNGEEDDVYETITFESNKWIDEPEEPVWENHVFDGWYEDEECTIAYEFEARCTESKDLYAKWRTIYTLEAEYTYLEGKPGRGYSGESSGLNLIMEDNTENGTASNGYYVGWLYYNNASVDFELEAAEEVSDVTIVFRLSAEYDPLEVTGDELLVEVMDESGANIDDYDFELSITDAYDLIEENEYGKRDFTDYVAATGVTLYEGYNMISLVVNNNIKGSGGTMYAAAPIVDCMYIYTGTEVTIIDYPENIEE
ncbi:MAG: InlB B-repeat-containing protein [Lachnospiraceae bacterium]|nr:InlB B-repeat-containing protein [Lachnospiraceae bacterium]